MTQIPTPQYTSATLQVYYCRQWCELRVKKKKKKRHSRKLSIYTNIYKLYKHTTKKKKKEEEKKHYHDINIVIRDTI